MSLTRAKILNDPDFKRFVDDNGPRGPRTKQEFCNSLLALIWEFCLLADDEAMRHRREPAAVELGRKGGEVGGPSQDASFNVRTQNRNRPGCSERTMERKK